MSLFQMITGLLVVGLTAAMVAWLYRTERRP